MPEMSQRMMDKSASMDTCMQWLFTEPAVDKGHAKGKGKGIPQVGDPDGPMIVDSGWAKGWKVWIGDLPRNIDKVDIGKLCPGQIDVSVNNQRSRSGHAFSVITFDDLDLAMAAFQTLQWTKFDHGDGQMHWPSVKWFGHEAKVKH
jgi:hypothetical protein